MAGSSREVEGYRKEFLHPPNPAHRAAHDDIFEVWRLSTTTRLIVAWCATDLDFRWIIAGSSIEVEGRRKEFLLPPNPAHRAAHGCFNMIIKVKGCFNMVIKVKEC
ncbi:unnamed protein product [Victoria cruziana]